MQHPRASATRWRRRAQRGAHRLRLALPGARPRVGLVGFFGFGNYGDELFCEVYQEHLGPWADLRVLHDRPARPYFTRPVLDAVGEVDAVVIGGGDLVIPWNRGPLYWNRDYLHRPVLIAGVGVPTREGVRDHPAIVGELADFFRHPNVRWISARDEESAAWIEEHLTPRVPVRRTADLVCALSLPPVAAPDDALGIVTRFRRGNDDDYSAVAALGRRAQQLGLEVRHLVLATGDTKQRDLDNAGNLDLPGKQLFASDDLTEISRAIGRCRVLASMKFHGSLVATMYGRPSIVLMPTAKNRRFYDRLGRPELVRQFRDPALPDLLDPLPAPIDPAVREELRADATATLAALRKALRHEVRRAPTSA